MATIAAQNPAWRPSPQAQTAPFDIDSLIPQGATTVRGLGFTVFVCYLFMIFSRVFDMFLTGFHIPGLADRLMVVIILLSGSFNRSLRTRIGKYLLLFTVWIVAGVPFSVWRGNSLSLAIGWISASMVIFVAAGGLIADFRQYRVSINVTAVAILVLSIFCLHYGTMETGRLYMANRSRFSNPNDMAQALLLGIPFWIAVSRKMSSPLGKLACGAVMLFMAYIISKTGSRGALISFAVLYVVMLYHASAIGKARLLLLGSLFMCCSLAFLPSALKDRYKTLFSQDKLEATDTSEAFMLNSAVTSTESREHLLRQSLILTATHPIFGVGIGQFPVAENALSMAQGKRKGSWLGTHNSYAQVASETGLPGIFFFLCIFFLCFKATYSVYKTAKNYPELGEVASQAEALFLSLVCLAITDVFIHVPYTMLLPVLAGLTVSLVHTTRPLITEVQRRRGSAGLPASAVRPAYPPPRRQLRAV